MPLKLYLLCKRLGDLCAASLGLILLSPLLTLIGILIKVDSSGPVFYRGVRVGLHGRNFRIFKFRSLVANADTIGGPSTADDDPRVTTVGRLLRTHKLDELPQLLNVLKGEMSLVGPRPEVPQYIALLTPEEKQQILSVQPGMTDLASLWNIDEGALLKGSPDPEKTYLKKIRPEKVRLQIKYVKKMSVWTDLKILGKTIINILYRK